MSRIKVFIIFTVVTMLFSQSWAQWNSAASIHSIADISGQKPQKIKIATDKVKIQRGLTSDWINARPKTNLFRRNRIKLDRHVCVDLRIKRRDQEGRLILMPDSLQAQKESAVYLIEEEQIYRSGRIEYYSVLTLEYGTMFVDWADGELEVIAAGIRNIFLRTKAVFIIGRSGEEGILFLERGYISFPDYPEVRIYPGEAIRLRRGLPPESLSLAAHQGAELQNFINYNTEDLWSSLIPWYLKPSFYIPMAMFAGGMIIKRVITSKANEPFQDSDSQPGDTENKISLQRGKWK